MLNLRSLFSGLGRRRSPREEGAHPSGPAPGTAPETLSGAVLGNTAANTVGSTVRTTVDQQQTVNGQVNATVLHDVLVNAGVNLESNQMQVVVGAPRLVSSNLTASDDGKSMVREDEIRVEVVIRTRQQLAMFVDALAGATVDAATLTLTPASSSAPTVSTLVEPNVTTGSGS